MSVLEFFYRLLGRDLGTHSKDVAKERLRTVLVHDRAGVSPQVFEKLKVDLIRAASRYMDVDEERTQVHLHNQNSAVALVASMPVLRMKSAGGQQHPGKGMAGKGVPGQPRGQGGGRGSGARSRPGSHRQ